MQGALEAMAELGALEAMAELGALEAMAVLGALEAMAVLGALEAMADGHQGLGLIPRPGHSSRNPSTHRTVHDRTGKALQGQTNRTGHPTGTRSPPGLAWKLRLPLGMT